MFTPIAAIQFTCHVAVWVHCFTLTMCDVLAARSVVMMIRQGLWWGDVEVSETCKCWCAYVVLLLNGDLQFCAQYVVHFLCSGIRTLLLCHVKLPFLYQSMWTWISFKLDLNKMLKVFFERTWCQLEPCHFHLFVMSIARGSSPIPHWKGFKSFLYCLETNSCSFCFTWLRVLSPPY